MTIEAEYHLWGAAMFGAAVLHTFLVNRFQHLAHRFREGSSGRAFFHLLGEVEVVFSFWAGLLLLLIALRTGPAGAVDYLESRNFAEPTFVFAVLSVCSTRPVLRLAESLILGGARLLPVPLSVGTFFSLLTVGPALGSLITEPAAMAVSALLLLKHFFEKPVSLELKYAAIGLLFVNISIGGTLTPYAAPPVLMVAGKWGWSFSYMMGQFGWKGMAAAALSTALVIARFRRELSRLQIVPMTDDERVPRWIKLLHLLTLAALVLAAHHPVVVTGIFLFFLGVVEVTKPHHDELRLGQSLLVALFLAGLVVLGGFQAWWLEPLLSRLTALPLYLGAAGLTAFTDNAALTYLGSLVPSLSESSRYALVAGAVAGGGLTVMANAPNPAGFSILQKSFGGEGISPARLFFGALPPTLVALACFWFL